MKQPAFPEFAVRRETFDRYFDPPISRSTFYDLVNQGKIVSMRGPRGYYLLNASLRQMGMPPVDSPPGDALPVTRRVLAQMALSICMPGEMIEPPELLHQELSGADMEEVTRLAMIYGGELRNIVDPGLRVAFAQGALDACELEERGLF